MNTKTRRMKRLAKEQAKCSCSVNHELKLITICSYCSSLVPWIKDWQPSHGYKLSK